MTTSNSVAGVQPYLFFGGRCEEAFEFYRKALGAEVVTQVRFKEAPERQPGLPECFEDKVMHATLRVGDTIMMASDGMCEGAGEDFLGAEVWNAPGSLRRRLDGFRGPQALARCSGAYPQSQSDSC
jgi:uncharacterized glyoxalase superfamily protein PhnB